MYANILIPTDGSELAGKAVQHGLTLAKRIGAKATVLTVLPPFHTFTTDTRMIEDTPGFLRARTPAENISLPGRALAHPGSRAPKGAPARMRYLGLSGTLWPESPEMHRGGGFERSHIVEN
jgi:hypothetical protein